MKPEVKCLKIENSRWCTRKVWHKKPCRMEVFNRCGQIENGRQCQMDADWHAHQPCWFGEEE